MKQKTKEIIFNIGYILFLLIAFLGIVLPRNLQNLDEIWNFNFARNIANGLLPYKDFNMLQTPLLSFILGGIFKIFGTELIVARVVAGILGTAIIFMSYKILQRLGLNKKWSVLSSVLMIFFIKDNFNIDYNYAILLVTLILIYLELGDYKKSPKYNILIGVLAGITILFKQSVGAVIAVVTGFCILINNVSKENLKNVGYRIIGVIIPVAILIIYLLISNSFASFWDYCVLGIKTFANNISYLKLLNTIDMTAILAIAVPIAIISFIIIGIKKKDENKNLVIGIFGLEQFIIVYPIADEIHFQIASFPIVLAILYVICNLIQEIKPIKLSIFIEHFMNIITISIVCMMILFFINELYYYNASAKSVLANFKNIPISEGLQNRILEVDEFIKSKDKPVYILDSEAAVYMIPLNRYNKDYDMFLKGNIGSAGEEGQIEKLKNMEDAYILIKNEKTPLNWQTPKQVINYVRNNLEKVDTISFFYVYEL